MEISQFIAPEPLASLAPSPSPTGWTRRDLLRTAGWTCLAGSLGATGWLQGAQATGSSALPLSVRFKGQQRFEDILVKARREGWRQLPIGERVMRFAKQLHGTPYVSYTLEIDDHIEAPSANLDALDCWSFFEISLNLARMIAVEREKYEPDQLLKEIQFTRYRGGVCTGNYLQRLHYLEEWFFDNQARGVVNNITKDLGGAIPIHGRKCQEMTILWKSYRYLAHNPELRPRMGELEAKISQLPVYYLPEKRVAKIENKLQNGDILGIVTKDNGAFCSHVGLACRTEDGVLRLMHASSQRDYRRVVIDKPISAYLDKFGSAIGIIVGRPRETSQTVRDAELYRKTLTALVGPNALITNMNP